MYAGRVSMEGPKGQAARAKAGAADSFVVRVGRHSWRMRSPPYRLAAATACLGLLPAQAAVVSTRGLNAGQPRSAGRCRHMGQSRWLKRDHMAAAGGGRFLNCL